MSDWPYEVRAYVATTPGLNPSAWTDVGSVRDHLSIQYGRDRELMPAQAGIAAFNVDNHSGAFEPGVAPNTMVRVEAVHDAVVYPLFRGPVEEGPALWPQRHDAVVAVAASDGSGLLARTPVTLVRPKELTSARVIAALDAAGWPAALRDIEAGVVRMDPLLGEGGSEPTDALRAIHEAVTAEQGMAWVAGDGSFTFRNRHSRFDQDLGTPPVMGEGGVPIADLLPEYGGPVFPAGRAEMKDGTVITTGTPTPGYDVFTVYDVDVTDQEARAIAEWAVARYGSPQLSFRSLTFQPRVSEAAMLQALQRQPGDLLRVTHTPTLGSSVNALVCIEQVTHNVQSGGHWATTWVLSPYHGAGPWLRWDDATTGFWDAGNKWMP